MEAAREKLRLAKARMATQLGKGSSKGLGASTGNKGLTRFDSEGRQQSGAQASKFVAGRGFQRGQGEGSDDADEGAWSQGRGVDDRQDSTRLLPQRRGLGDDAMGARRFGTRTKVLEVEGSNPGGAAVRRKVNPLQKYANRGGEGFGAKMLRRQLDAPVPPPPQTKWAEDPEEVTGRGSARAEDDVSQLPTRDDEADLGTAAAVPASYVDDSSGGGDGGGDLGGGGDGLADDDEGDDDEGTAMEIRRGKRPKVPGSERVSLPVGTPPAVSSPPSPVAMREGGSPPPVQEGTGRTGVQEGVPQHVLGGSTGVGTSASPPPPVQQEPGAEGGQQASTGAGGQSGEAAATTASTEELPADEGEDETPEDDSIDDVPEDPNDPSLSNLPAGFSHPRPPPQPVSQETPEATAQTNQSSRQALSVKAVEDSNAGGNPKDEARGVTASQGLPGNAVGGATTSRGTGGDRPGPPAQADTAVERPQPSGETRGDQPDVPRPSPPPPLRRYFRQRHNQSHAPSHGKRDIWSVKRLDMEDVGSAVSSFDLALDSRKGEKELEDLIRLPPEVPPPPPPPKGWLASLFGDTSKPQEVVQVRYFPCAALRS